VAEKFDGSQRRRSPGRPRIGAEIEELVVRLARENSGWGYDWMVGALANLGHQVSDQTVGNILRRHGIGLASAAAEQNDHPERLHSPAYERSCWRGFLLPLIGQS
jgi:hypothetical protein